MYLKITEFRLERPYIADENKYNMEYNYADLLNEQ